MKFDICMAFDKAEYLNPEIYLMLDTLKNKIDDDTVLHIVTNRSKDDEMRKFIKEDFNSKIYYVSKDLVNSLDSRCRYMLNCFKMKTDKEWVMKIEADVLFLKHLSEYESLLKDDLDLVIEPENRKIFPDEFETRLWRLMYRAMKIKVPTEKIQFRENGEMGLPLFGTGIFFVKSKHLDTINKRWMKLTQICERWMHMNVHPNEQAFTGMALDEGWKIHLYHPRYKFNPIGHWRKDAFPSVELIDDCVLPGDTVCFDYHRPEWLMHVAKFNKSISDIVCRNDKYIPKEWWNLGMGDFHER